MVDSEMFIFDAPVGKTVESSVVFKNPSKQAWLILADYEEQTSRACLVYRFLLAARRPLLFNSWHLLPACTWAR